MTVVVWDGKTLATDRQANDGYMKWEAEKAWYMARQNTTYNSVHYIVSGVGTKVRLKIHAGKFESLSLS